MNSGKTRLVVATGNPGKLAEIRELLHGLGIELLSLADFEHLAPVEEDAMTLEGNAVKKARVIFESTGIPTIADDTGLEVDVLGGEPGVFSARYAGPDCEPVANRIKLLAEMSDTRNRRARFRTVIALVSASETLTFDGVCEGSITTAERGSMGFGYDALFVPSGSNRTFAEMDSDEKNEISHRGKALRKLRDHLQSPTRR